MQRCGELGEGACSTPARGSVTASGVGRGGGGGRCHSGSDSGARRGCGSSVPLSARAVGSPSSTELSGLLAFGPDGSLGLFTPFYPAVKTQVQTPETARSPVPGRRRGSGWRRPCLQGQRGVLQDTGRPLPPPYRAAGSGEGAGDFSNWLHRDHRNLCVSASR